MLGLLIAAIVPMSLLPHVSEPLQVPVVGEPLMLANGGHAIGPHGIAQWLEPVTAVAPRAWPPSWGMFRRADIARDRAGLLLAVVLRARAANLARPARAGVCNGFDRPPNVARVSSRAVAVAVAGGHDRDYVCLDAQRKSWEGLLTALLGLVGSGCLVWAVRLIGTFSLRREAMGFGDVTLMMMIGTFLGWQACLILFFISPFAALLIGIIQFISRRDDVIPFGPFLCLAAAAVVVWWAPIWMWAQPMFEHGSLVPLVLAVCLILLGVMLTIWRMIKNAMFGDAYAGE